MKHHLGTKIVSIFIHIADKLCSLSNNKHNLKLCKYELLSNHELFKAQVFIGLSSGCNTLNNNYWSLCASKISYAMKKINNCKMNACEEWIDFTSAKFPTSKYCRPS